MKIGVSSYSFSRYMEQTGASYCDICDLAKEIGFDGIEFIDLSLDRQPAPDLMALAGIIRAHCEAINLPIIAYTVSADFSMDPDGEVEKIKDKLAIAQALGVPVMRHDAAWGVPEGMDWRTLVDHIAPAIRQVAAHAQTLGIRTCTENHGYVLQDAHRVETLMRTVNHDNYGWLIDLGNFLCADDTALHALPIAAPYVTHAHAKDFLYRPVWEQDPGEGWFPSRNGSHLRGTVPGCGVVPIAWAAKYLKEAGYTGYLSYEFEGMEDNLPAIKAGYAYLRKVTENL